jgi:hypothetical protein
VAGARNGSGSGRAAGEVSHLGTWLRERCAETADLRVAVEHALAHAGHWQGRRARYLGTRKNLFDLRRVAIVHNFHVIARHPTTDSYHLAV